MANEGDETPYGVEVRDRGLTPAETEKVAAQVRATDSRRSEDAERVTAGRWALRSILVAASALVWRRDEPLAIAVLGLVLLETVLTTARARSFARARLAHRARGSTRGPWEPPPGGWTVRETRVVARSVVRAASGNEDLGEWTWLLFEIPGGDWFYLRVEEAYRPNRAEAFARAEVVLTRLSPHGPLLDVSARGESLSIFDAPEMLSDGYDAALRAGSTWNPEATWNDEMGRPRAEDDGVVREPDLPAWVLAAVGRPRGVPRL